MQAVLQNLVHARTVRTQALFLLSLVCSNCQDSGITKNLQPNFPFPREPLEFLAIYRPFPRLMLAFSKAFAFVSCAYLSKGFSFSKESAAMLAAKCFFQVFGFQLGEEGCPDVINDL